MSIATPTRLDHVQALRGVAAFLVLIAHLMQIEGRTASRPLLPSQLDWGMMGVDLFFVISGFIMVYITRDWRAGGGRHVPEFLFARVSRIYPLYWIISAALLAVWFIRPDLVFSSSPNDPQLLNSLLLVPAYAYPMLEVGWTLVYEMMFYILFAIILILPARLRPFGLAIWAGLVIAGNQLGGQTAGAIPFHLFSSLSLEFLAGAATALIYLRFQGSRPLAYGLVGLGLIGMGIWFFIGGPFQDEWPRVIRLTGPACGLILGAAWLDRHGANAPRVAVRLGDWSYSLYLTHLLSLVLVAKLWTVAGLRDVPAPILIIALIAFSLLVAGLTYHLIEKPLIGLAKRARLSLFKPTRA
ncbi:MAG: acyltransferase family protein [Litorimonas sp.]